MAGKVGNPYRDPVTGKFTSGSGLNRANSTATERVRAGVRESARSAGRFAGDVATHVVTEVGRSALLGVKRQVRRHAEAATAELIRSVAPRAGRFADQAAATAFAGAGIATREVLNRSSVAAGAVGRAASSSRKNVSAILASIGSKFGNKPGNNTVSSSSANVSRSPMWQHQESGGVAPPKKPRSSKSSSSKPRASRAGSTKRK